MPQLTGPHFELYLFATLLLCLTPGPNVMLMISTGLGAGRGAVLRAVAGIGLAHLIYIGVAAAGLLALLAASELLYTAVRWAGAAYLVWLGLRLLWAAWRPAGGAEPSRLASRRGSAFWQGFVTHISNPKAVLFWTALLPQFVDRAHPVTPQIVTLGAVGVAMDLVVMTGYGLAAAWTRRALVGGTVERWLDAAAGLTFTTTGLWLATLR